MRKSERRQRLIELLPKLVEHLHAHAAITSPLGRLPEDDRGKGEAPQQCDCGKPGCRYCDELWVYVKMLNERRHPLEPVKRAFVSLYLKDPLLAQAVWHEYVDPWRDWNPTSRKKWADSGLNKMLKEVGNLRDKPRKKRRRRSVAARKARAMQLAEQGATQEEIAEMLRMSKRDVVKLVKGE